MFKNQYDPRFGPFFDPDAPKPPVPPRDPHYPYVEPCVHDSYAHSCSHEYHGYPSPAEFPAAGPMKGSAFYMLNYYPYLFDNTHVRYGNFLNMAENVVTRISQRRDDSCVNLVGTFDMTSGIKKNAIMNDYLEQCIGKNYETMQQVFPIFQSDIVFRIYFSVLDEMGGFVYQNAATAATHDVVFHFTDIRDFFIQSAKSIFVANIPAMDYNGIYRLRIEKIEAYLNKINTIDHLETDGLNPYYAFTNNNNSIMLQHDVISGTLPDEQVLLATLNLDQVIPFQANITTRLRLSFTAFLSDMIAVPQTYGVWAAMFEPTQAKLEDLQNDVTTLKESVALINTTLANINAALNELRTTVSDHETRIETNTTNIATLTSTVDNAVSDLNLMVNSLDARVTILENRPLALIRYGENVQFVTSQLTWSVYGQLYQAAKNFTASGTMSDDIANGNLVPIVVNGEMNLLAITESLNDVEQDVAALTERVETDEFDIGNLKYKDTQLTEALAGKADASDLESLTTRVEVLEQG